MNESGIESFEELRQRLGGWLLPATAQATERVRLLTYLRENGCHVSLAADFFGAIASLPGEEEVAAHGCQEGVAVSHASDGWWLLFRFDEPVTASSDLCAVAASLLPVGDRTC